MMHTTTIETHRHRSGVRYYRPRCTCGWYLRSLTRSRENADAMAAAHVIREAKETTA